MSGVQGHGRLQCRYSMFTQPSTRSPVDAWSWMSSWIFNCVHSTRLTALLGNYALSHLVPKGCIIINLLLVTTIFLLQQTRHTERCVVQEKMHVKLLSLLQTLQKLAQKVKINFSSWGWCCLPWFVFSTVLYFYFQDETQRKHDLRTCLATLVIIRPPDILSLCPHACNFTHYSWGRQT